MIAAALSGQLSIAVEQECHHPGQGGPRALYDGSVLGGRPLIAHGTGRLTPVVLAEAKWLEIRKRIEEVG